jgi:ubiquinone/menaquinone biosynthesis C-methylase UbiE
MLSRCRRAFDEYRACRIAAFSSRFIDLHDRVLDCGCGHMIVARSVRERIAIEIFGVDVINLNDTDMQLCIYDGRRLPFADNSFDIAYLAFVLHHTLDPRKVMRECLRVARRWLIVLEDVYGNKLDLALLKALDWVGNRPFCSAMSLPYNFKSTGEWMSIFHDLGARVVRQENVRPLPWRPTRHRMFVVEAGS